MELLNLQPFSGLLKMAVAEEEFCSAPLIVDSGSNSKHLYWKVTNPTLSPSHLQGQYIEVCILLWNICESGFYWWLLVYRVIRSMELGWFIFNPITCVWLLRRERKRKNSPILAKILLIKKKLLKVRISSWDALILCNCMFGLSSNQRELKMRLVKLHSVLRFLFCFLILFITKTQLREI